MLPKNKKLIIFDFDQTLCNSNALVRRVDLANGQEDFLSAGEYIDWRETGEDDSERPRWELDFKEFDGYPNKGERIKPTFKILEASLFDGNKIVAIVTGRDELAGPKQWLEMCMIPTDKMILICTGDPNKRPAYESLFNTLSPTSVELFEDSIHHIEQCRDVCGKYNLPFKGFLVEAKDNDYGIISF